MPIVKIISGGQTGADHAGLSAGELLGLKTGGWMPHGFKRDTGPNPFLAERYDLKEHESAAYPPRTKANVEAADATLLFGDPNSPGCQLTRRLCNELKKP